MCEWWANILLNDIIDDSDLKTEFNKGIKTLKRTQAKMKTEFKTLSISIRELRGNP